MFRDPADKYKERGDQYLSAVGDSFVFDAASGIYKPKTYYKQQKRKSIKKLWKNFRTHWALIILSAATLFYLIKYTHYTQKLWEEARRTADESVRSANAASDSAETASSALQDSKNSFQVQNRPYAVITSNSGTAGFVRSQNVIDLNKVNITYGNVGKTPAYDAFIFTLFTIERFSKDDPPSRTFNSAIEDAFKVIAKEDAKIIRYYGEIQKVDVPPGANAPFVTVDLQNGPLTDADRAALGQTPNTILLLSVGRIHYKAFDRTKSYSTDFCYYYFGNNPLIWHYCPTHNLVH